MFRFLELSLHGWDLWHRFRVPLDRDVVLLSGPNGSGKTTFLDAIRQLLGASRLSSKRRLQHYLRTPDQPCLIRAVVTNGAAGGSQQPFRKERITTPEVTLACALVPASGGAPEKRYVILPGRPPIGEIQQRLLDGKGYYGPEQYARALETAGVSRSLMAVLAIEQGSTHTLFELSPRELFRRVLEMLGDKTVLDRYTEARRRFDDASQDLDRQTRGLLQKQAQLETVQRKVRELDEWEEVRAKVAELEARLPAAQYQRMNKERQDQETKLRELRTKVRQGESERLLRRQVFEQAQQVAMAAQDEVAQATGQLDRATAEWNSAHADAATRTAQVAELENLAAECAQLASADLVTLERANETAAREAVQAIQARESLSGDVAKIEARINTLEAGVPAYPQEVATTLSELESAGIKATLLCHEIASLDDSQAEAVEAALGDGRFGLLVSARDVDRTFDIGRRHDFPGPVFGGVRLGNATRVGPATLEATAPDWLRQFLATVTFGNDGSYADVRGKWRGGVDERFIGGGAIEESLRTAQKERELLTKRIATASQHETQALARQKLAGAALAAEHRRLTLLEQIAPLGGLRTQAADLNARATTMKHAYEAARERHSQATTVSAKAVWSLENTQRERDDFERQLDGEKKSVIEREQVLLDLEAKAAAIRDTLLPDLRIRAEAGNLDGEETVASDLKRARDKFASLPAAPEAEVRLEAKNIELNIAELERHVAERTKERDRADQELLECRLRYLEIINHTLADYKARATQLGRGADVVIEMDLPALKNDEKSLEEARIDVRFGFDGKDTLPLGDSSFSGGQQVIAGLILLMSMSETEGGFFMLDEPFAHLSIDRVDQVGQFLRSSKAQFLITAPTTLDRGQLDPASMVIVLQKKPKGASFAPAPLVAIA